MLIQIVTIFPEMIRGPFEESIVGRAVANGLAQIEVIDLRIYTNDKHKQVDDCPYGGGKGMVMKPEPLFRAVEALNDDAGDVSSRIILMSPQGQAFNQQKARELSGFDRLVLICGHYEGVDQRVVDNLVHEEISLGDFILTGGEIPAMAITDAVIRLIPGVLSSETLEEESFEDGLLEYPHYTRPPDFRGMQVPEVLLSGNHALIKKWRRERSLDNTRTKRPDLYKKAGLTLEDND